MTGQDRTMKGHEFIGTYRCICGRRVRVYDVLPDQPLCARCSRDIDKAELKQ